MYNTPYIIHLQHFKYIMMSISAFRLIDEQEDIQLQEALLYDTTKNA